jgi:PAS domain S-box-containing protein
MYRRRFPFQNTILWQRPWRSILILSLLTLAAFAGNYLSVPLFFGVDLLFGSIFVFLVAAIYGIGWGSLVALIASSYTWQLWGHPYAIIIFTLEAVCVGWCWQRGRRNLALVDALYWLLLGMPLVWLFYSVVMGMETTAALLILLKQPVNGIFNALIATQILYAIPSHWRAIAAFDNRNNNRYWQSREISFQEIFSSVLVTSVVLTVFCITAWQGRATLPKIEQNVYNRLSQVSTDLLETVRLWHQPHQQLLQAIADTAASHRINSTPVRSQVQLSHQAFPDFLKIYVTDANGRATISVPATNERGETIIGQNFSGESSFQQVRQTKTPQISEVHQDAANQTPHFGTAIPIVTSDRFAGMVYGSISIDTLEEILKNVTQNQNNQRTTSSTSPQLHNIEILLLGKENQPLASNSSQEPLQPWQPTRKQRQVHRELYQQFPEQDNLPAMKQWRQSRYILQTPTVETLPWKFVVQTPASSAVENLQIVYIQHLAVVLVCAAVSLLIAPLASRKLVASLDQLAELTQDLPEKLFQQRTIYWDQSDIREVNSLIANFRQMSASLSSKIWEIERAKVTLEERVTERTQELSHLNERLQDRIQEVQESKAALLESEKRFRLVVEYAPIGVAMVDNTGTPLFVNTCLSKILGYSKEELCQMDFTQFTYKEDIDLDVQLYQELMGGLRDRYTLDKRFIHKTGKLIWGDLTVAAVRREEENATFAVAMVRDVTERHLAEQKLRELSDRLELALQAGKIGVWEWDVTNDILFWDDRMYELFDIPPSVQPLSYQTFISRVHPDDRSYVETTLQNAIANREKFDCEFRIVLDDGTIRFIKGDSIVRYGENHNEPTRTIGINWDLSDRKHTEEQLRQTNRELERATRLKDEFLANMSHELRTPLNSILGMCEGLQEEVFGTLTDKQHKSLTTIERSGKHLLDLINEILDLSKIESGKLELEIQEVSLYDICQSSLTFVRQMAYKKNIHLSQQVPQNIGTISVDERRLRQILINLLTNAVKFTPNGGSVTLEVMRQPPTNSDSCGYVSLSVVDTGIGIHPNNLNKLFQEFVQIDSNLNRRYGGTGLGLSLVRRLTELHGGTVTVDSELGEGSRFTVHLPYGNCSLELSPTTEEPEAGKAISTPNNRQVLLVEDSTPAADHLTRYLREMELQVHRLSGTEDVLQVALQVQPSLIVLDIQLPQRSGWEILQQLKHSEETQKIPVLVVSVVDDRCWGLALGASEYLVKPVNRNQFQTALAKLRFYKPTAQTNGNAAVATPETPDESQSSQPVILLAEDDYANVSTISSYLEFRGYQLLVASDGKEALAMAAERHPDLILMDVQMPDMDGLEATRRIRANPTIASIPIVALTALAMSGDREKCLEAGANEYIAKPVRLKQLSETIRMLLAKSADSR